MQLSPSKDFLVKKEQTSRSELIFARPLPKFLSPLPLLLTNRWR
jgi:hypothetical protein